MHNKYYIDLSEVIQKLNAKDPEHIALYKKALDEG